MSFPMMDPPPVPARIKEATTVYAAVITENRPIEKGTLL
jgi:hypothetical protein